MPKQRDPFENELAIHVGRNVRRLRNERNISTEALAKTLRCSVRALQSYEAGARRISLADAIRIAVALNVDLEQLTSHLGKLFKTLPQVDISRFNA